MVTLSAVDFGLDIWSGQIKDYKICIWCFHANHAAVRSKNKVWPSIKIITFSNKVLNNENIYRKEHTFPII
jgi:hypothetical protein